MRAGVHAASVIVAAGGARRWLIRVSVGVVSRRASAAAA